MPGHGGVGMETIAPPTVTRSQVEVEYSVEHDVARLGIIALSTDLTSERDAARLVPQDQAAVHVARIPFHNPSTPENLARMAPDLSHAADLILPEVTLSAIAFSCTAASVEIGDAAIAQAIHSVRPGVPIVTPPDAAVAGFAALGIRRIALVTPYLIETTAPMADYFARRGLELASVQCLGIADDRDIARVSHQTIVAAAIGADRAEADGVFLSCTALPALGAIAELEAHLGKPVISSNQAFIWQLLRHARVTPPGHAPGHLFDLDRAGGQ